MANSRFYSSIAAATNLQVTAAPSDVSIQVASSSGFPGSFPFTLSLDYGSANEELVDVTAGGPNVFTVTRAVDGTSASTHNAGAVVRHVTSARDFTDSRTHEAATSNVHGVTGALVGATQTQTLTNKTLTSPTINGAALSGNLTGSPTFTGPVLFNAGPSFTTSPAIFQNAVANAQVIRANVPGDTQDRWNIDASGRQVWGPGGSTVPDTNLYRAGANALQTDDTFIQLGENQSIRTGNGDISYRAGVGGDSFSRFTINADGTQKFGTGAVATDLTVGRTGVGQFGVTGNLAVSADATITGNLTAATLALTGQVYTSFTPVWHGTDASMFTNIGWYTRYGKIVFYEIYTSFSTTSSLTGSVSVDLPTTPLRTGPLRQQMGTVWYTDVDTGGNFPDANCMGHHCTFAGDTGTTTGSLRNYKDNILTGGLIKGPSPNTIITIQGFYREA